MKAEAITTPSGRKIYRPIISEAYAHHAVYDSLDDPGFCVYCGTNAYGVEPDAQRYRCESCNELGVWGLSELILKGFVIIE